MKLGISWLSAVSVLCLCILTSRAIAALPGVSFLSDFEASPTTGKWGFIEAMSLDRLSGAGWFVTWHGKKAVLVDVRPGDNPMSCCIYSERVEVSGMKSDAGLLLYEDESSGTQYFAVSYKFPQEYNSVAATSGAFQIILQLHGPNPLNAPPALALDIIGNAYKIRTNGGDLRDGNRYVTQELFDSSLNAGYWSDFIIAIKFASDNTGRVTVWRRNQSESRFRQVLDMNHIPTLQYNSARDVPPTRHYWKQGMYRIKNNNRDLFLMGPTARGTSFLAVERAAFNTSTGAPQ